MPETINITCLRQIVSSGAKQYPVYIGFSTAEQLLHVAEAPSFSKSTRHEEIAANVLKPPVEDWQRPLDTDRVKRITAAFSSKGELMPNPVLLSALPSEVVRVTPGKSGEVMNGTYDVSIKVPGPGDRRPLWILDGQHRINGLGGSAQKQNPLPLVLLLGSDVGTYNSATFAKIFAQVTTAATPLDRLHNEWLTFAFDLGTYGPATKGYSEHRSAFATAATLCRDQFATTPDSETSPFFDKIALNPEVDKPSPTGSDAFSFSAVELKDVLHKHYWTRQSEQPRLSSSELATEIVRSYNALRRTVTTDEVKSVFFAASASNGQRPMQIGWISGILEFLLVHEPPDSWDDVFKAVRFHETDWNFKTWTSTTGGTAGLQSLSVAVAVMREVFHSMKIPLGSDTVSDFMQGNGWGFDMQANFLNSSGAVLFGASNPPAVKRVDRKISGWDLEGRQYLKLVADSRTSNVADIKAQARHRPMDPAFSLRGLKTGVRIAAETSPLVLDFRVEFYGGTSQDATLNISF